MSRPAHNHFGLTISGRIVDFLDPQPESFHINDIAHCLAVAPRWTGHTKWHLWGHPYCVAQHSVAVSHYVKCKDGSIKEQLWGLLHDASEAYLSDVNSPAKSLLLDYKAVEARVMAAICERFGLPLEMPELVHKADAIALNTEARDLCHEAMRGFVIGETLPARIQVLAPMAARRAFLDCFSELAY